MTCIVGIQDAAGVTIGGDSATIAIDAEDTGAVKLYMQYLCTLAFVTQTRTSIELQRDFVHLTERLAGSNE